MSNFNSSTWLIAVWRIGGLTTIGGALVSVLNIEGKPQEEPLAALDRHLIAKGFKYVGPRRDWNRAYVFGSRKSATLALRLQRRKNGIWLLARPSYRSAVGSFLGLVLGFLIEIAILLVIIFEAPSLIRDNPILTLVLGVGSLFVMFFAFSRGRRRLMQDLPAMRAAYREARGAAFSELAVKVEVRDARMPFNYLDSLSFERDHPQKIYAGNTYDIGALLLGLVLPALAGVYLLLRRRGGWIRLVYSFLLSLSCTFLLFTGFSCRVIIRGLHQPSSSRQYSSAP